MIDRIFFIAAPSMAVVVPMLLLISSIAVLIWVPDKWERRGWNRATVIKVCPGRVPVVRLPDGQVWVRLKWDLRYPVENENTVC